MLEAKIGLVHKSDNELLQQLPERWADLIITDPPFSLIPDLEAKLFTSRLKSQGFLLVFCSDKYIDMVKQKFYNLLEHYETHIWVDPRPTLTNKYHALKNHDYVLVFRQGTKTPNLYVGEEREERKRMPATIKIHGRIVKTQKKWQSMNKKLSTVIIAPRDITPKKGRGRGRPPKISTWKKPLKLITQLIRAYSSRGDRVVDPYIGWGTSIQVVQQYPRLLIAGDNDLLKIKKLEREFELEAGEYLGAVLKRLIH